jgi:dihydropteroate synthase
MGLATIEFRKRVFDWSRIYIAGVVNVTPDSFSDGGVHARLDQAVAHGRALVAAGADLVDIGGESTRPGATPVDEATEIERVVPVIRALAEELEVPISVDTTKAAVARAAVEAGAEIINDISGGLFEPAILDVAGDTGAAYVCGHVLGRDLAAVHAAEDEPPTFEEVAFALAERVAALPAGLRHRTIVDPGLGFGKRTPQNLALLRRAGALSAGAGCPVMVGPSRKRFIVELTGARDLETRDLGTIGACLAAVAAGAHLVRAHNVALLAPALRVYEAAMGRGLAA